MILKCPFNYLKLFGLFTAIFFNSNLFAIDKMASSTSTIENHSRLSTNLSLSHDLFRCPDLQIDALTKLSSHLDLTHSPSTLTDLDYILGPNELSPFTSTPAPLQQKYLTYVEPFLKKFLHDKSLPQRLTLIQSSKIQPLEALYCPSLNQSSRALTIIISPDTASNSEDLLKIIVHEFIHDYFYKRQIQPVLWYEEGTALLAEYIFSGTPSGAAIVEHFQKPQASFLNDISSRELSLAAYGEAQLFFIYLHNFLGDELLADLLSAMPTSASSISALNQIIASSSKSLWRNFNEAYRDFQIAKYVNRIDYFATTEQDQKKYFIFQSTLHANFSLTNAPSMTAIGVPIDTGSIQKNPTTCYAIYNSKYEPIKITQLKDSAAISRNPDKLQNTNEHFIICP